MTVRIAVEADRPPEGALTVWIADVSLADALAETVCASTLEGALFERQGRVWSAEVPLDMPKLRRARTYGAFAKLVADPARGLSAGDHLTTESMVFRAPAPLRLELTLRQI